MDYKKIGSTMQEIALSAGKYIKVEREKLSLSDVEIKSQSSLVTYVDKQAEKMIVERLHDLLPTAGFVTEEDTAGNSGEELMWIVDPLDGTTNYIHGLFPASVSIALALNGEPVAGVVYEIGLQELYSAWGDTPATLNGKPIQVSKSASLQDALIGTGFPYYDFERIEDYINVLRHFMRTSRGLRRMGSAAVDLCYVAAGRFDAFFEHALHAWDIAAGACIVKNAGGIITDFNGGDQWLYGGEIVVGSAAVFPEFFRVVHENLGRHQGHTKP